MVGVTSKERNAMKLTVLQSAFLAINVEPEEDDDDEIDDSKEIQVNRLLCQIRCLILNHDPRLKRL